MERLTWQIRRPIRPADEIYDVKLRYWGKSFTSPLLFPSPCAIRGSLLYSLVLGGTQAQLGTTQTQEGPHAKGPTSRTHLVQCAEHLWPAQAGPAPVAVSTNRR